MTDSISSSSRSTQAGFTVIEVLVALMIFAIIMAVVIPGMLMNMRIDRQSSQRLSGTSLIQDIAEDSRRKVSNVWARYDDCYVLGLMPMASADRLSTTAGQYKIKYELAEISGLRNPETGRHEIGSADYVGPPDAKGEVQCPTDQATLKRNAGTVPLARRLIVTVYPSNSTATANDAVEIKLDLFQGSL